MAKWIECIAYGSDKSVFVNLDNVAYMARRADATPITIRDGVEIVVRETPESILAFEKVQQGA